MSIDSDIGFQISFDLTDPIAVEFILKKPINIRNAYNIIYDKKDINKIKENIRETIQRGYVEGAPIRKIAEKIQMVLSKLTNITFEAAMTIARTEIIGAANYGRYIAIKDSGFKKKEWITARDEDVRQLHKEMEAQIIDVANLWEFSDGNRLRYPGDHEGPDHLVICCRCVEVVVPSSHKLLAI